MWNTPKRLERLAASKLASLIILNSLPAKFRDEIKELQETNYFGLTYELGKIDPTLLRDTDDKHAEDVMEKRMKKMHKWWKKCTYLGNDSSFLRTLIRGEMTHLFSLIDKFSDFPLFRFACQLLYTKRAGENLSNGMEMKLCLPRRFCDSYARFLASFENFGIECLLTTEITFGNPNPLIAILKKSPLLKFIHLRNNSSDYVLIHISRHCPLLQDIFIDSVLGLLCISVEYLYKAFFKNKSRRDILTVIPNILRYQGMGMDKVSRYELRQRINRGEYLSFKHLKKVQFGAINKVQEFLLHLSFFYPEVQSLVGELACGNLFQLSNFDERFFSKSFYQGVDELLLSDDHWSYKQSLVWEAEEFKSNLCNVRHATYMVREITDHDLAQSFFNFIGHVLSLPSLSSFTLYTPRFEFKEAFLIQHLIPLVETHGSRIKRLCVNLIDEFTFPVLWKLINSCTRLSCLKIFMDEDEVVYDDSENNSRKDVYLNKMSNLESLSIFMNSYGNSSLFRKLCSSIFVVTPNIENLELCLWEDIVPDAVNYFDLLDLNKVKQLSLYLDDSYSNHFNICWPIVQRFSEMDTLICHCFHPRSFSKLVKKLHKLQIKIYHRPYSLKVYYNRDAPDEFPYMF